MVLIEFNVSHFLVNRFCEFSYSQVFKIVSFEVLIFNSEFIFGFWNNLKFNNLFMTDWQVKKSLLKFFANILRTARLFTWRCERKRVEVAELPQKTCCCLDFAFSLPDSPIPECFRDPKNSFRRKMKRASERNQRHSCIEIWDLSYSNLCKIREFISKF